MCASGFASASCREPHWQSQCHTTENCPGSQSACWLFRWSNSLTPCDRMRTPRLRFAMQSSPASDHFDGGPTRRRRLRWTIHAARESAGDRVRCRGLTEDAGYAVFRGIAVTPFQWCQKLADPTLSTSSNLMPALRRSIAWCP